MLHEYGCFPPRSCCQHVPRRTLTLHYSKSKCEQAWILLFIYLLRPSSDLQKDLRDPPTVATLGLGTTVIIGRTIIIIVVIIIMVIVLSLSVLNCWQQPIDYDTPGKRSESGNDYFPCPPLGPLRLQLRPQYLRKPRRPCNDRWSSMTLNYWYLTPKYVLFCTSFPLTFTGSGNSLV